MAMTIGRMLVSDVLPPELQNINEPITTDKMEGILASIIETHPEDYSKVSKSLMDVGGAGAFDEGITLRLSDSISTTPGRHKWIEHARKQARKIRASNATKNEKEDAISELYNSVYAQIADENYNHSATQNNPFALQVKSKARGNKLQLAQLMATPGTFKDGKGKTVPLFIGHSYSEGLTPAEYWGATYGARQSVISTKFATAEAGELGKQMVAAAMRMVVTGNDCDTLGGIPVKTNDTDNIGSVLARGTGDVPAGSVITKEILSKIKDKDILVRSPITCGQDQGICQKCSGVRETGRFPEIGDYLGVNAASALAERIAQGALNCLAAGTEVRMADFTTKRIEDIAVGDKVLGADIFARTFPVAVTMTWDQGLQPVQQYGYKKGGTREKLFVECTEVHPVLSNTKKSSCIEADLNYTMRKLPAAYKCHDVAAVLPVSTTADGFIHDKFATLIGLWLGDGCRNCSLGAPVISCADAQTAEDLIKHCAQLSLGFKKSKRSYDWRVVDLSPIVSPRDESAGRFLSGYRNRFKRRLHDLNLLSKYARDKFIPKEVWQWSTTSVLQLIGGYLAADGSVYKSCSGTVGVSFASTSYKLLAEVKALLEVRLCVYAGSISRVHPAGTGHATHDCYALYITRGPEVEKLFNLLAAVPFIGGKLAKLQEYIGDGLSTHHGGFYRCVRSSIVDKGIQHCYDISVAHKDELFVLANGLIVKNTKHSGGQKASAHSDDDYAGFEFVEQFTQIPKNFRERATLADGDGRIESIEEAPQGGMNVIVGDTVHYVLPGHDIRVKLGDEVEAGDELSSGLVNPEDIIKHKGLGEGRRYFTNKLTQLLRNSGWNANRRNVEVLSRALVNHVNLDDSIGDGLPGDVLSYSHLAKTYKPRVGAISKAIKSSRGMYLESPVLHYSIGTRVDNKVMDNLNKFGVSNVQVHSDPPQFNTFMPSLRSVPSYDPDWMAQLGSSYLKSNLLKNMHRGAESTVRGTHPLPGIAKGVDFSYKADNK